MRTLSVGVTRANTEISLSAASSSLSVMAVEVRAGDHRVPGDDVELVADGPGSAGMVTGDHHHLDARGP